ncbi:MULTISPECIES: pantoate--beta-alanine ligase [unclassified Campylobacter]|uniref:pantoate--beta-alanine ligase n=1 Tax=unclassified Campylobacter TaxID=2593542 RepID=UPI001237A40E|nr:MULTISPECIES: pantoate--beta-alanine ligase [unclassified Campylobacter]KAA6224690.1 pantoate--beta-alanine ligase [Campylobacter sp. LR185c]KAA6225688.1 pantoate--beta-alanine ligase [Campylobacter sp. LR286c]KAA6225808.1 pantoate--beta-alanine ligase [Campylobacter sp. LR196d]KAA8603968.1 pantoate--beta-alanine ligase [Campylobacter sp. LR185c]
MQVINEISKMKECISQWKKQGFSIGFVPTMGYLHEGHLSLVRAGQKNYKLVLSIFVNPMQFGVNEDLAKYPRNLEKDTKLCEENGVDILFIPNEKDMYPSDFSSFVDINSSLTNSLCGTSRPGHFRGVCTILTKLFNIIEPNIAYFGQKDAQQCAVVKQLVKDLNLNVKIEVCPIVRESDNLAKSSRNVYLNDSERKAATILSKAIFLGQNLVLKGERNTKIIKNAMQKELEKENLAKIDYISLVDPDTMQEFDFIQNKILGAIAVYIGKTRLIDNFLLRDLK